MNQLFYPPEIDEAISNKELEQTFFNIYKFDIFSFGLILCFFILDVSDKNKYV